MNANRKRMGAALVEPGVLDDLQRTTSLAIANGAQVVKIETRTAEIILTLAMEAIVARGLPEGTSPAPFDGETFPDQPPKPSARFAWFADEIGALMVAADLQDVPFKYQLDILKNAMQQLVDEDETVQHVMDDCLLEDDMKGEDW